MLWSEASTHVVRFGKYRGKTLDGIAATDEGLLYLDWLVGQPWLQEPLKGALQIYLADSEIARALDDLLESRG